MQPEETVFSDQEQLRRDILRFHGLDPDDGSTSELLIGSLSLEELFTLPPVRQPSRSSDRTADWFAAEYSKIASDQSAQPSPLTIPSELSSPDYLFGLETRDTVLWLHAHTDPRLYTVTARGGEILAAGITLDELERRFPEFTGFERLGETDLLDDDR